VNIMLPMVTCISEITQARALLEQAKEKLEAEQIPYCKEAALGIMIETPASAVMAEQFAKHCDFFSVGTNDLIQYMMCADRGNPNVEYLYNPFHPAVIQMLYQVISAGERAGIPVSVCGDMAADLRFTKLLLGLGLKKFSVPFPMIARMKYKIGTIDLEEAKAVAKQVLREDQEQQIQNLLKE
ncbi:MAG: putative PEP-binding protein, partial [Clostridia bacterium]|nr:putative PEP-binding protein [Clostridia bacterium]